MALNFLCFCQDLQGSTPTACDPDCASAFWFLGLNAKPQRVFHVLETGRALCCVKQSERRALVERNRSACKPRTRSTSILIRHRLFCLMISDLKEGVMRAILERNQREDEEDFQKFCDQLLSLPRNLEFMPKENFVADVELQPWRWLSLGIDLLQSRKVTRYVELADGIQGPPMSSYLPYPVFQMATEIFLKGMWLYQYPDCRTIKDSSYVDPDARNNYLQRLGRRGLGHDLLKIIEVVR